MRIVSILRLQEALRCLDAREVASAFSNVCERFDRDLVTAAFARFVLTVALFSLPSGLFAFLTDRDRVFEHRLCESIGKICRSVLRVVGHQLVFSLYLSRGSCNS